MLPKEKVSQYHNQNQKLPSQIFVFFMLSLVVLTAIPTFAWLYAQKSIQTVTKIEEPNALIIGAGDAKAIKELELSNIDVESGNTNYKDVVFCVYSENYSITYDIQLAHTTNTGLQYEIFPAQKTSSENNPDSVTYLEQEFYFNQEHRLAGAYLNKDDNIQDKEQALSSGNWHDQTYKENPTDALAYNNVQVNAEPLYWKTTSPVSLPNDIVGGKYIDYYVLRIKWEKGSILNNKETDLVYLMAEMPMEGNG